MGILDEAIGFAARAHAGQPRKGTDLPYIWHPLAVGRLLQDFGCPEEVIVAGILHDTTEDTGVTLAELTERFGDRVAGIVRGCAEPDKSLPWETRKAHTLEVLPKSSMKVRLVAAADKIDNLRSIAAALTDIGEVVWTRFRRGREQQEWYYRGVARAVAEGPGGDHPLFGMLAREVAAIFGPGSRKARGSRSRQRRLVEVKPEGPQSKARVGRTRIRSAGGGR